MARRELDLDALPAPVRRTLEALITGEAVTMVRGDRELGQLTFQSSVLEGVVLESSRLGPTRLDVPDGVQVVATAMPLSDAARRRLSDEFGDGFLVLDFNAAPETAEVLLTHPLSPQLMGMLRGRFPHARIVVAEVDDPELGLTLGGPLSELRDAGVEAYLPPRRLAGLAVGVQQVLEHPPGAELDAGHPQARHQLPAPGASN